MDPVSARDVAPDGVAGLAGQLYIGLDPQRRWGGLPFRVWVEKSRDSSSSSRAKAERSSRDQSRQNSKERPAWRRHVQYSKWNRNCKTSATPKGDAGNGRYQRQNTKGFGYGQRAPE
jgi:hypothetical protein